MKEKRIITMFITSAIALVVSLVVTFGIVLTLADPVEATGLTRYAFNYKGDNDALIAEDGAGLKFATDVIYSPSGSIVWKDKPASADINDDHFIVDAQPDKNGLFDYTTTIRYGNESYSSKVKVIPFRLKNDSDVTKTFELTVKATGDETLLAYSNAKILDYSNPDQFSTIELNITSPLATIEAGSYKDYIIVIFTDETLNIGDGVNYGEARLNINLFIK